MFKLVNPESRCSGVCLEWAGEGVCVSVTQVPRYSHVIVTQPICVEEKFWEVSDTNSTHTQ